MGRCIDYPKGIDCSKVTVNIGQCLEEQGRFPSDQALPSSLAIGGHIFSTIIG